MLEQDNLSIWVRRTTYCVQLCEKGSARPLADMIGIHFNLPEARVELTAGERQGAQNIYHH